MASPAWLTAIFAANHRAIFPATALVAWLAWRQRRDIVIPATVALGLLVAFLDLIPLAGAKADESLIGPASQRGSCTMRSHCRQQYSATGVSEPNSSAAFRHSNAAAYGKSLCSSRCAAHT